MADLIRIFAWERTSLGPCEDWPQSLRTAVDMTLASPIAKIVLWGPDLVQIYNDGYREIMATKHPSGLGMPTRQCWPEVWSFNAPIYESVFRGENRSFQAQHLTIERHGRPERAWFDLVFSPLRDETTAVSGVLVTVVEITGQVLAEQTRRQSEERLRLAQEVASVGTFEWNVRDDVNYWSPEIERLYGLPPDGFDGTYAAWRARLHPEDVEAAEGRVRHALETGVLEAEWRILKPDGALAWLQARGRVEFDEAGEPLRMIGANFDITDRKLAENALRYSERRMRTLMEGIPQLVWRSAAGGQWTWTSPQWCTYTGMSEAQSLGLGWLRAIHPDDREATEARWAGLQGESRGEPAKGFSFEHRIRSADGTYRWFQTRGMPVHPGDAGADAQRIECQGTEWLGTCTDIDELRRLQEQQSVMMAELQHRTRNLLAVVSAISRQTMARSHSPESFNAQFTERLAALSRVQGLLSRADEKPITIEALVRMELEALGAYHRRDRIAIEGPEVRLRNATVQTMALAIHELATNARKYGALASGDGLLWVTWEIASSEPQKGDGTGDGQGDGAGERRLLLTWRERGVPMDPDIPTKPDGGYGRELIERALPFSLGARTRFGLSGEGLDCVIDLPLRRRGSQEVAG